MVEAFADETILTGGAIDLAKLKPLLFDMSTRKYWGIEFTSNSASWGRMNMPS
jgi:hypothetical protein